MAPGTQDSAESLVAGHANQPQSEIGPILLERLANRTRPGARNDNHRVVLVVEGGGMRGVVSAGMLLALEQIGMRYCFDAVVGTSAGAIGGAFFVAGSSTQGSVVYYSDLNSAPFLNKRRLLRFGPAMDLDFLIDEALPARCLLYTSPSPRDQRGSRMPSSA